MEERDIFNEDDPYVILNIDEDASKQDIKKAYVKLIKIYKPESNPAEFKVIREAYEQVMEWVSSDHYYQPEIDYEKERETLNLEEGFEDKNKSPDYQESENSPSTLHKPEINIDAIDQSKIHLSEQELNPENNNILDDILKEKGLSDTDEAQIVNDKEPEGSGADSLDDIEDYEELEIFKYRMNRGERFIDAAGTLYDGILEDPDMIVPLSKLLTQEELLLFLDEYPIDWDILGEAENVDVAFQFFKKIIQEKFDSRDYIEILEMLIADSVIEKAEEDEHFNEYILQVLSYLKLYLPGQVEDVLSHFNITEDFEEHFEYISSSSRGWLKWWKQYRTSPIFDLIYNTIFAPFDLIEANLKRLYDLAMDHRDKLLEQLDILKKYKLFHLLEGLLDYYIKSINHKEEKEPKLNLLQLESRIRINNFSANCYGLVYLGLLGVVIRSFYNHGWWGLLVLFFAIILFAIIVTKQAKNDYNPNRYKILQFLVENGISYERMMTELNNNTKKYPNLDNIKGELEDDRALDLISTLIRVSPGVLK